MRNHEAALTADERKVLSSPGNAAGPGPLRYRAGWDQTPRWEGGAGSQGASLLSEPGLTLF